MCRWMGSHFHDWIDYYGIAFSIELLEWGSTFSDFFGVRPKTPFLPRPESPHREDCKQDISQVCLQSLEHYKHYKNMQFLKVKIAIKQTNKLF